MALGALLFVAAGPAHFERGKEIPVHSAQVGPPGATLSTGHGGTPVDDITVAIPAGAFASETTVTLSYNTGTLALNRGESSGVFLGVAVAGIKTFQQPVTVCVHSDAQHHPNTVVVGYAIDTKDRLQAIDIAAQNRQAGTVTFSTFVPLLLTWVYAPVR